MSPFPESREVYADVCRTPRSHRYTYIPKKLPCPLSFAYFASTVTYTYIAKSARADLDQAVPAQEGSRGGPDDLGQEYV